jgi:hypothetical protein
MYPGIQPTSEVSKDKLGDNSGVYSARDERGSGIEFGRGPCRLETSMPRIYQDGWMMLLFYSKTMARDL